MWIVGIEVLEFDGGGNLVRAGMSIGLSSYAYQVVRCKRQQFDQTSSTVAGVLVSRFGSGLNVILLRGRHRVIRAVTRKWHRSIERPKY